MKRIELLIFCAGLVQIPLTAQVLDQWTTVPTPNYFRTFTIDPVDTGTIYATYSDGMYKTTDGGSSWTQKSLWVSDDPVSIIIHPISRDTIYMGVLAVGTGGVGVYRSPNKAATWSQVYNTRSVNALCVDPSTPGVIYAGTITNSYSGSTVGILKSTNGGTNWTASNSGLGNLEIHSIAIHPLQSSIVFAGTADGMYKSTDSGANWFAVSTGLPSSVPITSIAMHPSSTDIIYITTYGSGIYKTTDAGGLWTECGTGVTDGNCNSIAINPQNPLVLAVTTNTNGIFVTRNGGRNWTVWTSATWKMGRVMFKPLQPDAVFTMFDVGTTAASLKKRLLDIETPAAPTNLSVESGPNSITLKWIPNLDTDFSQYRVYGGTSPSPTTLVGTLSAGANDTAITFTGLPNGLRRYYRITAVDTTDHESAYSSEVSGVPFESTPPSAPQELAVTPYNGKARLVWRKSADADVIRYHVHRSTSPNAIAVVDSTASISDTTRLITGLTNGLTYYFRITAIDSSYNRSPYSNEESCTPGVMSYCVAPSGNDGNPGTTVLPLKTIAFALSTAGIGDTIKVAAGTYTQNLTTSKKVILKGSYTLSFSESDRDLIGSKSVIRCSSGSFLSDGNGSTIDGFYFDGSVTASYTYPDGITLTGTGYSTITHNVFGNFGTSYVYCIEINSGAGARVKNNTIARCGSGTGIHVSSSAQVTTVVENNIITGCSYGFTKYASGITADYNCVAGNSTDYSGGSAAANDMTILPRLVNPAAGDFQVKYGSPCIDAGNPADAVGDEPEPNGGRVNIGAYGGTKHARPSGINPSTHVSTNGSDANDGSAQFPYRNIQTALERALGDTIKVAIGVYNESIVTMSQALVRGGYSESFTEAQRDPHLYRTVLRAVSTMMWVDIYGVDVDGFFFDGNSIAETCMDLRAHCTLTHNVFYGMRYFSGTRYTLDLSAPVTILNNTFYNCDYTIWILDNYAAGTVILNNVFLSNDCGMYITVGGITYSHNAMYNNSLNYGGGASAGLGDIGLNPLLRDPANLDFRLQDSSPCINAGNPDSQYNDPDGTRNDMGAFYYFIDSPPAAPTGLAAEEQSKQALLKWRQNQEPDFRRYVIMWGTAPGSQLFTQPTSDNRADTSCTIGTLQNGTRYYARVKAVDIGGNESPHSNEVSFIPVAARGGEYLLDSPAEVLLHFNESSGDTIRDENVSFAITSDYLATAGRFGNARYSNGPGSMVIFNADRLNFGTGPFTVECWLKLNFAIDPSDHNIWFYIFRRWPSAPLQPGWMLSVLGDGSLVLNDTPSNGGLLFAQSGLVDDKWHHVAVVRYSNEMLMYLDGRVISRVQRDSAYYLDNSLDLQLMTQSGGPAVLERTIDEVRFSRTARSSYEFNLQAPPRLLDVQPSGINLLLSWQNGGGVVPLLKYRIYRGYDSTNFVLIDSSDSPNWTDTHAAASTRYFYRISAVDSTGFESAQSDAVEGVAPALYGEYAADASTAILLHCNEVSGSIVSNTASFHHGMAQNASIVDGRFGKGRAFSDSGITVFSEPMFNGPFTAECWVLLDTSTHQSATLISKRIADGAGWHLRAYDAEYTLGEIEFALYASDGDSIVLRSDRGIRDGKWHHVAAVQDANNISIVIDGKICSTEQIFSYLDINNGEEIVIGRSDAPGLTGVIDEVRVSTYGRQVNEFNLQSVPISLSAQASANRVVLQWNSAGGAVGLKGYNIYKGTSVSALVRKRELVAPNFTDDSVGSATPYVYAVTAVDSTGFESALSDELRVVTERLGSEYAVDANTVFLAHFNELEGQDAADVANEYVYGWTDTPVSEDGRFGHARMTDADQRIYFSHLDEYNVGDGDFTIEAWRKDTTRYYLDYRSMINKYDDGSPSTGFVLASSPTDSGRVWFMLAGASNTNVAVTSTVKIDDGKWHHVAAVRRGNELRLFIDGLLNEQTAIPSGFGSTHNSRDVVLGINGCGMLDEMRMSNVARSPETFNLLLPPKGVAVQTFTDTSATLTWQAGGGGSNVKNYLIYRGSDSGAVSLVGSVGAPPFTDYTLQPGTSYYFRVVAADSFSFESVHSFAVSVRTKLLAKITAIDIEPRTYEGSILIPYTLSKATDDTVQLACLYSVDGGGSYVQAHAIDGKTTEILAESDTLWWQTLDELGANEFEAVRFMLVPSGMDGEGVGKASAMIAVDNKAPAFAGLESVTCDTSGTVARLTWKSAADISAPIMYYVYGEDAGTQLLFNVPIDSVASDTLYDVRNLERFKTYAFAVRARDAMGHLDTNTRILSVAMALKCRVEYVSVPAETLNNLVPVSFRLSGAEGDTVHVAVYYALGDNDQWIETNAFDENLSAFTEFGGEKTFRWKLEEALPLTEEAIVRLRLIANGRSGEGISNVSGSFAVDTKPPSFGGIGSAVTLGQTASGSAQISWQIVGDFSPPVRYYLYRSQNGAPMNFSTPFDSTGGGVAVYYSLAHLTFYSFAVRACDRLGNVDTNTIELPLRTPALADYNNDSRISAADLSVFAYGWRNKFLSVSDIGPASGVPPNLLIAPDSKINFEDLMVFGQMWNWSLDTFGPVAPKRSLSQPPSTAQDELKSGEPVLPPGTSRWFSYSIQPAESLFALGIAASFDGGRISVDSIAAPERASLIRMTSSSNEKGFINLALASIDDPLDKSLPEGRFMSLLLSTRTKLEDEPLAMSVELFGPTGQFIRRIEKTFSFHWRSLVPAEFALMQNYPNPFNPSTTIEYHLPVETDVSLVVYNLLGQAVASLADGKKSAGYYELQWDGRTNEGRLVSSGVYMLRLKAGDFTATRRMIVLR